jgi:hypothetical protein
MSTIWKEFAKEKFTGNMMPYVDKRQDTLLEVSNILLNNLGNSTSSFHFRYTSYSELELQCRSGEDNALFSVAKAGKMHDQQLWATFTDADGKNSAICAFSLAKLRLTFWYNIDRCRGGTDSIGLPHIGRDAKCTNVSVFFCLISACQKQKCQLPMEH